MAKKISKKKKETNVNVEEQAVSTMMEDAPVVTPNDEVPQVEELVDISTVTINTIKEHVFDKFNLDNSFQITGFKAKDLSLVVANSDYELSIKCTGEVSNRLQMMIQNTLEELNPQE